METQPNNNNSSHRHHPLASSADVPVYTALSVIGVGGFTITYRSERQSLYKWPIDALLLTEKPGVSTDLLPRVSEEAESGREAQDLGTF